MSLLREAAGARFLGEHPIDDEVLEEHPLHGMLVYLLDHNRLRLGFPQPRPDGVIRRDKAAIALSDAKYRERGS